MYISEYKAILENNYILLLTSNSKEKHAINKVLKNRIGVTIGVRHNGAYLGMIGNVFVIHLSGESGTISEKSIGSVCNAFLSDSHYPKPSFIILAGICWGDPKKVTLGQTIVSDNLFTANQQKVTAGGYTPNIRGFSSKLTLESNIFSSLENIVHGSLCSAELLMTDESYRDKLLAQVPSCSGGEMEGFTLIPVLGELPWLIIKTVSDYADAPSYIRDEQKDFCNILASSIESIIPIVIQSRSFSFDMVSNESLLMYDFISGKKIDFNINDFDLRTINTFLNDEYGAILIRKLSNYIDGEVFQDVFIYDMTDAILELVQNEFRHNNALNITVTFNDKTITIVSESDLYDVSTISGSNGGALAWHNLYDKYIQSENIAYEHNSKKITFRLNGLMNKLNVIKSKCRITLNSSKSGYSSYRPLLEFDQSCNSVHYDMRKQYMSSRALGVFEQIEKIAESGKVVYISVRDFHQKERYFNMLLKVENNIKFLY